MLRTAECYKENQERKSYRKEMHPIRSARKSNMLHLLSHMASNI